MSRSDDGYGQPREQNDWDRPQGNNNDANANVAVRDLTVGM